jgi:hypothetical protein
MLSKLIINPGDEMVLYPAKECPPAFTATRRLLRTAQARARWTSESVLGSTTKAGCERDEFPLKAGLLILLTLVQRGSLGATENCASSSQHKAADVMGSAREQQAMNKTEIKNGKRNMIATSEDFNFKSFCHFWAFHLPRMLICHIHGSSWQSSAASFCNFRCGTTFQFTSSRYSNNKGALESRVSITKFYTNI